MLYPDLQVYWESFLSRRTLKQCLSHGLFATAFPNGNALDCRPSDWFARTSRTSRSRQNCPVEPHLARSAGLIEDALQVLDMAITAFVLPE